MGNGEGKGWAKGRTAANDARIARNAASHRGRVYVSHLGPERDRRYARGTRTLPLEWSDTMAYVVGLLATDGCLITRGRRHISFDSGDEALVRTYLACLGRPSTLYRALPTKAGRMRYKAQFSDVRFYRWLETVGLMPRKSLVLGAIAVPDRHFSALLRGLFEGDGHIQNFTHRPTIVRYPDYQFERLWVCFNSASRPHLEWIRDQVARLLLLQGLIEQLPRVAGRHDFFRLKYGNRASVPLLRAMYPRADVPKLDRKWRIWADYAARHRISATSSGSSAEGGT